MKRLSTSWQEEERGKIHGELGVREGRSMPVLPPVQEKTPSLMKNEASNFSS
jgi:hypothetical protein